MTADSPYDLTSLSNGDVAATATSEKALISLSGVGDTAFAADTQKALTSLSTEDVTAPATAQKALTSLARSVADILAPAGRSDSAAAEPASEVRPFIPPGVEIYE
ncbi:MAG: hypothetical protein V5A43_03265 [Haloarculaceae archaeon]